MAALEPTQLNPSCVSNICSNVYSGAQRVRDDYFTLRADYKISDKDSMDASYYRDHSNWAKPNAFDNQVTGYILPNQSAALEETHIFSSAMTNSARFGYTQSIVTNPGISAALAGGDGPVSSELFLRLLDPERRDKAAVVRELPGVTSFGGFAPPGWIQRLGSKFPGIRRHLANHRKSHFQIWRGSDSEQHRTSLTEMETAAWDLAQSRTGSRICHLLCESLPFLHLLPETRNTTTAPPFSACMPRTIGR